MNTLAFMAIANRLIAAKPIEFDGIRTKADQMRTLPDKPNSRLQKYRLTDQGRARPAARKANPLVLRGKGSIFH